MTFDYDVSTMKLIARQVAIPDVLVLEHEVFEDERGFFMEVYRRDHFRDLGLPERFLQLNHSRSARNVIRGLHFQWDQPMGKLMRVTEGSAYLVAVDIRPGSPTLGRWVGEIVSSENKRQLWAPAGFARGFCVISDFAQVEYLCTAIYNPSGESGICWNDPAIGIDWPVGEPILSDKDSRAQSLADWLRRPEADFFRVSPD
jgi:dTDP-4-dehydrorhamnose 3,5-epimerase